MTPWIRFEDEVSGKKELQETYVGLADAHKGARALIGKILRMGIYWPDI